MVLPTKQFFSLNRVVQNLNGFGYTTHELEVKYFTNKFLEICSEPLMAIDIGANIGLWTSQLIKNLEVLSRNKSLVVPHLKHCVLVEPSKFNCIKLREKFKFISEIEVLNIAVSNFNGVGHLCALSQGDLAGTIKKREMDSHQNCESVEVIQCNNLLERFPNTNCLKLDTEGSEFEILSNISLLNTSIKIIQFEFGNPPYNHDSNKFFQDYFNLFSSNNWKLFRISPKFLIPIAKYSTELENRMPSNYLAVNNNY